MILTLSLISYLTGFGQDSDSINSNKNDRYISKTYKKTEVLTGFDVQYYKYNGSQETRQYVELGIARSVHLYNYHGPVSIGYYISEEVYFGEKNIYGTKIGAYTHYMFDVGFSIIYYTDFDKGNLKLRPEIGLGMGAFRIIGGYNIPTFANKAFPELRNSKGQINIQCFIPVKKKLFNREGSVFKYLFKN